MFGTNGCAACTAIIGIEMHGCWRHHCERIAKRTSLLSVADNFLPSQSPALRIGDFLAPLPWIDTAQIAPESKMSLSRDCEKERPCEDYRLGIQHPHAGYPLVGWLLRCLALTEVDYCQLLLRRSIHDPRSTNDALRFR